MNTMRIQALQKPARARRIAREIASITILIVTVLAARSTLADHYHVPSGSMEPTLKAGDRVVVDKRAFGLRVPFTQIHLTRGEDVAAGEVVIFDSPRDGKRLIKRIVAVGGDTVAISNGRLVVNGRPLALPGEDNIELIGDRIVSLNLDHGGGPNIEQLIPAGKLLAVGDHRGNSLDGRMFGLIDQESVYGRAIAVYYRSNDGFVWNSL
ncbi:MAG: signal peptidase I [Woeseiaceae bacterium]